MTTQNQPPFKTLRDGALKASIWKNTGKKGAFYSVLFSRTYKDDQGNLKDTDSFSNAELLRLANLATRTHNQIREFREADKQTQKNSEQEGAL